MGDEAGDWLHQFLKLNRQHDLSNNHNIDDPVDDDEEIPLLRLVTLEDPKKGRYTRQANPDLPDVHSPFTDKSPVSFGFEASLKKLNDDLVNLDVSKGATIGLDRFRNNLTISGTLPYEEDAWLVVK